MSGEVAKEVISIIAGGLRARLLPPVVLGQLAGLVPAMSPPVPEPWVFEIDSSGLAPIIRVNGRRMNYRELAHQVYSTRVESHRTTALWLRQKRLELDSELSKQSLAPDQLLPILRDISAIHKDSAGLKDLREAFLLGRAYEILKGGK